MKIKLPVPVRVDARWVMLAVAVCMGALAAWLIQRHLHRLQAEFAARAHRPTLQVVVAAEDLPEGAVITPARVAVREIPREWVASDALLPAEFDGVNGAPLNQPVRRGDTILHGQIEPVRKGPFSANLESGRRAVTIPVDEISSMSGMLEPGDAIDLYVSFMHQRQRITTPLLQNVRVLATGRDYETGEQIADGRMRGFATVTLDVTPEDAVKLVAARQQGSISAMLRHGGDGGEAEVSPIGDLATLLGINEPEAPVLREIPVVFGDRSPAAIPDLDGKSAPRPAEPAFGALPAWDVMPEHVGERMR